MSENYAPKSAVGKWFNDRLPLLNLIYGHLLPYPTPKNLNYWWTFGGILTFCLVTQIITGLVLAMHYVADADLAFASVEHIMRDVNYGWLLRYIHSNGAVNLLSSELKSVELCNTSLSLHISNTDISLNLTFLPDFVLNSILFPFFYFYVKSNDIILFPTLTAFPSTSIIIISPSLKAALVKTPAPIAMEQSVAPACVIVKKSAASCVD